MHEPNLPKLRKLNEEPNDTSAKILVASPNSTDFDTDKPDPILV
jgi:hypothetical protein